jgi:NodT family efflux transporter outer membrane factor (OMF) lipoprotein
MSHQLKILSALTLLAALAGCMVGPDYLPPKPSAPAAWSAPPAPTAQAVDLAHWWKSFNDPTLSSLIDRAIANNLTLKQAQAQLRQSRAQRGIAFALLFPTVDLTSAFSRSQVGGQNSGADGRGPPLRNPPGNQYQMGLDAAWEVDIFGGERRGLEAADAGVLASAEGLNATLVSVVAEVALDYVQLRGYQQQIAVAESNLKDQQKTADITRRRKAAGFVSALDIANADAVVATTQAQIPVLQTSARQTLYALSILLGRDPAALTDELSQTADIPVGPPEVPTGLPSELLRRRPDVLQAEALLHAANAQIGVATADLFPKFTLVGSAGYQNGLSQYLTSWHSRFWSFGPSVDWQIFNAGGILSNIEVQKALTEQAMLTYEQTVLTALQDVENALVASANEVEHRKILRDAVADNKKAVELSLKLYTEGQIEFLNVLEAELSLYTAQNALVQSETNVSTDLVALYKALGGGWDATAPAKN